MQQKSDTSIEKATLVFDGYECWEKGNPLRTKTLNETIFYLVKKRIPVEKVKIEFLLDKNNKTMPLLEFLKKPEEFYKKKLWIMVYCVLRKHFKVNGAESFGLDFLVYPKNERKNEEFKIELEKEFHSKFALKIVDESEGESSFLYKRVSRLTRIAFNANKRLLLACPDFASWDFSLFFDKFPSLTLDDLKIIELGPNSKYPEKF